MYLRPLYECENGFLPVDKTSTVFLKFFVFDLKFENKQVLTGRQNLIEIH